MGSEEDNSIEQIKFIPRSLRQRVPLSDEIRAARESPAYWWFQCLNASDDYRYCCANNGKGELADTFKKFGDVFEHHFDIWWRKQGRFLFIQQKPLKTVSAITTDTELGKVRIDKDRLLLEVPLTMRKQTAMRKISQLLKTAYEGREIDIQKSSSAEVKFIKSRVRMTTVEQLLKIHRVRERYPRISLYEVGVRAGVELDLFARTTDGEILDETVERRRMTIAVSRNLAQARNLIDNAAHGVFPSLKPKHYLSI